MARNLVRASLGESGEKDRALSLLEAGWKMRDPNLLLRPLEARFAPLERAPRFRALVKK